MENSRAETGKNVEQIEWHEDISEQIENLSHSDFVGDVYVGDLDRLQARLPDMTHWTPFKLNWCRNLIEWENEDQDRSLGF